MDGVIETGRLVLRRFRRSDYDDLFEFLSQLENDEFEGYPGITYENGIKHLEERLRSDEFYAMELKDGGKVIGNLYMGDRPFEGKEAGFIVNRLYQRQGYALEALKAGVAAAFSDGIHRVYAECDPRNRRSWKLLEKAGFRREAHFRQNVLYRSREDSAPRWKDTYVYAILRYDAAR